MCKGYFFVNIEVYCVKIYRISVDTRDIEFKEWFGDWEDPSALSSRRKAPSSVVVSDDGNPTVMYHGTTKDFQEFEVGLPGTNSNVFGSWNTTRNAIFFTPDPEHANVFTSQCEEIKGGNIRPVYLNIQSPLDFRNGVDDSILDEFSEYGINRNWLVDFGWEHLDDEDGKLFVDVAKKIGYDGVIFVDENPETHNISETYAVFSPNQIRSIFR